MTKYIISRLKVLEDYKPTIKTKFQVFNSIKKDDILEIKIPVTDMGKYSTRAYLVNTTKSVMSACELNRIFTHLQSINYINQ